MLFNINYYVISIRLNQKSLNNKRYNISLFAITVIYILENNYKIKWIKQELYLIYSLLVKIYISINIIKLKNIYLYYGRNTRTIGCYNTIKVLVIIILQSKKVLTIIYLIKSGI